MTKRSIVRKIVYIFFISILFSSASYASDPACEIKLKLQDYEPNNVVARKDENDVWNIDFTISQMFPVFHDGCKGNLSEQARWPLRPYFSFTGQFGFYALGERDSKPVIGKRFNPKLFFRHWLGESGEGGYMDFGYAHESNGQSINTNGLYMQKKAEFIAKGERTEFADGYLSRGWDYLDYILKMKVKDGHYTNSAYLKLKYFLHDGLLQGAPEEFYPWETNNEKRRNEVDGITILLKSSTIDINKSHGMKFAFSYTTGYKDIFENNTLKLEATYKINEWPPILIWVSKGYNTDLTDYYKDLTSFGIGFELRNFLEDY